MGAVWFRTAGGNKLGEICKSAVGAVALYCAKYMTKDVGSGDLILTDALLDADVPRWGRLG